MPTRPRSALQIVLFAVGVAVLFGTLVATVSVLLRPRQEENVRREREAALKAMIGCEPELAAMLEAGDPKGRAEFAAHVVDLDTGCYEAGLDAMCFDVETAAADPRQRLALHPDQDIASIGIRPNRTIVYEVRLDGELSLLVLPVYGTGYQSRLEGFLSLEPDLNTISSLVFHSHAETPGMGARIGDAAWQASWRGKRLRDEAGVLRVGIPPRSVGAASPYEIDAMSGATRTAQGVTNLLRFWLGDLGYAQLIYNLQSSAACVTSED